MRTRQPSSAPRQQPDSLEVRPKRAGNYKPGPGRPRGRKNKKGPLQIVFEQVRDVIAQIAPPGCAVELFAGDAHALLVSIYQNPAMPLPLRVDAAKHALRFEKPMLPTAPTAGEGPLFSIPGSLPPRTPCAPQVISTER